MFVSSLMVSKSELRVAKPDDTLKDALSIMQKEKFLSLPVVEDRKFLGDISIEKIYSHYYEICKDGKSDIDLGKLKVREVMVKDIPVLKATDDVEIAAHELELNNVPFIAVIDNKNEFKGIVTHRAIFHLLYEIFGLDKGKKMSVIAYDVPGQISKLTKIVAENKGDILSCVVVDPKTKLDVKEIVLRIKTDTFEQILQKVRVAGYKVQ